MKDKLKVHTSSKSNEQETPKDFFKKYNDIFNFDIDINDSRVWVVGHWKEPEPYDSLIDAIKEFMVHYL